MASRDVQLRLTTTGIDDVVAKFDELDAKIDELMAKFDELDAKLDDVGAKLDDLSHKDVTPDVKLDGVDDAMAKATALNLELDRLNDKRDISKLSSSDTLGRDAGQELIDLMPGYNGAIGRGGGGGDVIIGGASAAAAGGEAATGEGESALGPFSEATGMIGPALIIGGVAAAAPVAAELVTGFAAAAQGLGAFAAMAYPTLDSIYAALSTTGTAGALALKKLSPAAQGVVEDIKNIENEYKKLATEFEPAVVKVLQPLVTKGGIISQLLQDLPPFANAAVGPLVKLEKVFNSFLASKGAQDFQNLMIKLEGPTITAIGEGIGKVAIAIGEFMETIGKNHDIPKDVANAFNALADAIVWTGDFLNGLAMDWDLVSGSIHEEVKNVENWVHDTAKWLTESNTDWNHWVHNVQTVLDQARHDIATWAEDFARWIYTDPHSAFLRAEHDVESWAGDVGNWLGRAVDWFERLPGEIERALETLASHMVTIGENAIEGLIRGFEDRSGGFLSDVESVATRALSILGGVFRSASPSQATREIGQYFGQGLEMGIEESSSGVMSAVTRLGHSALGGLAGSAAGRAAATTPLPIEMRMSLSNDLMQVISRNIRVMGGDPRILIKKVQLA